MKSWPEFNQNGDLPGGIHQLAALGGEQAAIEDWQIRRDGARRGIVEVISND